MDSREFFYRFGQCIYRIDAVYAGFAKQAKVSSTELWILYGLNDGNLHSQRDLCLDWGLPKSTVNTAILNMRNQGLVELVPIKGCKREMNILLTPAGKSLAEEALAPVYEKEKMVFEHLDGENVISQFEQVLSSFEKEEK